MIFVWSILLAVIAMLAMVLLPTLLGLIIGFVVGLGFPIIATTINEIAGTNLALYEIGLILGFISGILNLKITPNSWTSK